MDLSCGISGRDKEINEIYRFITSKIETKTAGILYLTGKPGTGKTMSIDFVLDKIEPIPRISLNCMRVHSSKSILTRICRSVGLEECSRLNESELTTRLAKKFSSRTSSSHLIVLDEIDHLPKSKNIHLIKTIFSWTQLSRSKLILIGIANTMNYIIDGSYKGVQKIIFKPYTSKDIRNILHWYIENDENFEDAQVESSALEMISKKFARDNGDIRGALNTLRASIDDTVKKLKVTKEECELYPTPPPSPPLIPCREKTNIGSVSTSLRKRQKDTHYSEDSCPFPHQVILTCLLTLCKSGVTSVSRCQALAFKVFDSFSIVSSKNDYLSMLDHLELQGMISKKKQSLGREGVILKMGEEELAKLLTKKDSILNSINS